MERFWGFEGGYGGVWGRSLVLRVVLGFGGVLGATLERGCDIYTFSYIWNFN